MKLSIANKDRSADLGAECATRAEELRQGKTPQFLHPDHGALSLADAQSDDEYLDRLLVLARMRCGIETYTDDVPARKGFIWQIVREVRRFLWKLMRYQHDHTFEQQVLLNELAIGGISFQRSSEKKQIEILEARIVELERQWAQNKHAPTPAVKP